MFTLELERQRRSALQSRQQQQIREGTQNEGVALANQTCVAESLNITTSKIRAQHAVSPHHCTNILNTALLSLTNYVPATANHQKQNLHKDLIFL